MIKSRPITKLTASQHSIDRFCERVLDCGIVDGIEAIAHIGKLILDSINPIGCLTSYRARLYDYPGHFARVIDNEVVTIL